jgi:hypothetical protein
MCGGEVLKRKTMFEQMRTDMLTCGGEEAGWCHEKHSAKNSQLS